MTLTNPVDDSAEQLNVTDPMGLSLISTLHSLVCKYIRTLYMSAIM